MRAATSHALRKCSDLVTRMNDPYDLSVAVIDILGEQLDYRRSAVLLKQGGVDHLSVFSHCRRGFAVHELLEEIGHVNCVLRGLSHGVVMKTLQTGQPTVVNDVRTAQNYVPVDERVRAEACFPMIANGDCIGVLNVESFQTDIFESDDILMMQAVTAQLSQHMDRWRLQHFLGLSEF